MTICMKCKTEDCSCNRDTLVVNEASHTVRSVAITVPKVVTIAVEVNGQGKLQMTPVDLITDKATLIRILRDIQQACQIVISKVE